MGMCSCVSKRTRDWIEWAQTHGASNVINRRVRLAEPDSHKPAVVPRRCQVRIEYKSPIDERRAGVELKCSIEPVCPEMGSGRSIDKLPCHTDAIRGSAHASFKHISNPQFTTDLFHVDRSALGKGRIARDNEELPEPRQRRDDLLNNAVREILLLGIAAHVLER